METIGGTKNGCIESIARIVGEVHVRPAQEGDAIDGAHPAFVVEPANEREGAQVLALANAAGLRVVPRGNRTKLTWGNPPTGVDWVLSTRRLDRVLEHAAGDMTATVQAGCTVAELGEVLAKNGQRLALDPLWPDRATVGGIIAANDSGALRTAYGTLRDHLIGITVALADGTLAKSGGKVVKNVAGYDLPKLFIGSLGTLGVITEATFRLYPLARVMRSVSFAAESSEVVGRMIAAFAQCALVTGAVQLETEAAGAIGVTVLVEGLPGSIEGKMQRVIRAATGCGAVEMDRVREESQIKVPWAARPCLASQDTGGPPVPRELDSASEASTSPRGELIEQRGDDRSNNPIFLLRASREHLFDDESGCVCKISLLPTRWPGFVDLVRSFGATHGVGWKIVGQAAGVGLLRLQWNAVGKAGDERPNALDSSVGSMAGAVTSSAGAYPEKLASANVAEFPATVIECLHALRADLQKHDGSLVILHCPPAMKRRIDVWPDGGNALPLMRRIKAQFDPNGVLSPGRFIGGI